MLFGVGRTGRQTATKTRALTDAGIYTSPTLDIDFTSGVLDPRITVTRAAGPATYFDGNGVLQSAGTNIPRFDNDPVTLAPRGLMIEEARTNLVLQSGNLAIAPWAPGSGTVALPVITAAQTTAPDGTLTGARIALPAVSTGGTYSTQAQGIALAAALYTFSVWLRGAVGGEQTYIGVFVNAGSFQQRVTLTTSWQRFSVTGTATASTCYPYIGTDLRQGGPTSTSALTLYAWGGQIELGIATSDIPTTSGAATRAVENPLMIGANFTVWFNNSAGSFFAEYSYPWLPVSANPFPRIFELSDGTANNFAAVLNDNQNNRTQFGSTIATVVGTGLNITPIPAAANAVHKVAASYGTVRAFASDGASGSTTPGGIATVSQINLGNRAAGDRVLNGYLRRLRFWNSAFTTAQLQQITT